LKRREALQLIPLSLAGMTGLSQNALSGGMPQKHPVVGLKGPLSMRYMKKICNMLQWVRDTQSENMLEASYAIARTIQKGGRCWRSWDMGHSGTQDVFPGRNGNPDMFTEGFDPKKAKNGDVFLACSRWGGPYEELSKKDILIIGMPVPWGGDAKGQEFVVDSMLQQKIRPHADIWIESTITTHGAIMKVPGIEAPFGPASGTVGLLIYWMIVADACRILARDGKSMPVEGDEPKLSGNSIPWINLHEPIMDNYFEVVMNQLDMVKGEMGNIRQIAAMAADTALSGGKVWCYSRYWESLAMESHGRRGGLYMTRGVHDQDGKLKTVADSDKLGSSKDMVIMGIWEPADEIDLKHLDTFRKYGMKIASIGPMTCDIKVPDGRTVPKEADVHAGRMCDTYGLYAVPGFDRKVCPTSGILMLQMFWATCMEIADELIRRTGNPPAILLSGAIKDGRRHNKFMLNRYLERGY
jgi:uncharacterized phosphosugar-binding protein